MNDITIKEKVYLKLSEDEKDTNNWKNQDNKKEIFSSNNDIKENLNNLIISENENQENSKNLNLELKLAELYPNQNNDKSIIKNGNLLKEFIGNISEAHHYILDNEFILKGYRINFHSCPKISKSLCMCHNETINIWTHFMGAMLVIFFMFLVIFNLGPINSSNYKNNKTSLKNIDKINNNLTYINFKQNLYYKNINNDEKNNNDKLLNENQFINFFINNDKKLKSLNFFNFINLTYNSELNKLDDKKSFDDTDNLFKFPLNINLFNNINKYLNIKEFVLYMKNNFMNNDFLYNFKNYTLDSKIKFNRLFIKTINDVIVKYNNLLDIKNNYDFKIDKTLIIFREFLLNVKIHKNFIFFRYFFLLMKNFKKI